MVPCPAVKSNLQSFAFEISTWDAKQTQFEATKAKRPLHIDYEAIVATCMYQHCRFLQALVRIAILCKCTLCKYTPGMYDNRRYLYASCQY